MLLQHLKNLDLSNPADLERVLNSSEFTALYNTISRSNPRLEHLPEAEKQIALALLLTGNQEKLEGLNQVVFKKPILTLDDFLTPDKYLKGFNIFPYWREEMNALFDPSLMYYEGVFGGPIGIGKSTAARICLFYNLIRVCYLRTPHLVLSHKGVTPDTILMTQMMSTDLKKAYLTLTRPFIYMMEKSGLFVEVPKQMHLKEFRDEDPIPFWENKKEGLIEMPNNIMFGSGSVERHALGVALIGAMLDEAEFRIGRDINKTFDLYAALKERIRSRFLGSRYVFLALVSSSKTQSGVIYNYCKHIKKDDPYTRIMGRPIWEVIDFNVTVPGHFYVLRGTNSHPSKILDLEYEMVEGGTYELPPSCEVFKVPNTYLSDFQINIEKSLQNLAGVQTVTDDKPFDNLSEMEDTHLVPEFHISVPFGGKLKLVDKLPQDLFVKTPVGKRLKRYPKAWRYLHLDLAETAEAGFSLVHKELAEDGSPVVVVDLVCWLTSPTRIDLDAIERMVIDLATELHVEIHTASADQFQSASMRQEFVKHRVARETEHVSVDRTIDPYLTLANIIRLGGLKTGLCPKLKTQLEAIFIEDNKVFTRGRKDMADAVCGATWNALRNVNDVPVYGYSAWGKETTQESVKKFIPSDAEEL